MNSVLLCLAAFGAAFMLSSAHVNATGAGGEAAGTAAVQGDAEAGKLLYKKECRGCHGPTAKGVSSYPKLRGQTAEYLADRLMRYRKGEKFGPNTPLMAPRAKKLSDDDIMNLSAFIAALE